MKRLLTLLSIAVFVTLLSCGGSGGGRGPVVLPTPSTATVRGVVAFANSLPTGATAFMGIFPPGSVDYYQFYQIPEEDIASGSHSYQFTGLDFGTYSIAVVVNFGEAYGDRMEYLYAPQDITITSDNPVVSGFDFTVEFPSAPSGTGSISGTVTFLGDFPDVSPPAGVYIGASVAIDQPSAYFVQITADDLIGNEVSYTLDDVAYGTYFISIFVYDPTTHKPEFFGAYDGAVTIDEASPNATGIDFDADPSLLD